MSLKLSFLLITVCAAGTFAGRDVWTEEQAMDQISTDWVEVKKAMPVESDRGTGCSCLHNQCGCCAHLKVTKIKLDATGCVNVTYLPSPEYGISVTFSLDGGIIYNYTVSVRNPPPVCFGIPKLTKYAGICLRFYDIKFSDSTLSACVKLEVKLEGLVIEKFDMGCFKIPPNQNLRFNSLL